MEDFTDIAAEHLRGREGGLCWNIRIPSAAGAAWSEMTELWRGAAERRLAAVSGAELSIRWEFAVTHFDGQAISLYMDMTEACGGVVKAFRRIGQTWITNASRRRGENALLLTDPALYLRIKARRVSAREECRYIRGGVPVSAVNSFPGEARERRFCPSAYISERPLAAVHE